MGVQGDRWKSALKIGPKKTEGTLARYDRRRSTKVRINDKFKRSRRKVSHPPAVAEKDAKKSLYLEDLSIYLGHIFRCKCIT